MAAPAISLVVTDLDGTVWDSSSSVHPEVTSALHEVGRLGYPLLVATGRRLRSTQEPLAELGLVPPAVVFNGGLLVDLRSGERLHRQTFHPETAAAVLAAFAAEGLSPCVYVDHDHVEVFTSTRPDTHPDHLTALGRWARPADLDTVVGGEPVFAFGILGQSLERLEAVADLVAGFARPHVSPDRQNGGTTITVNPPGLSKWDGVLAYCRHAGLDPGRVLAVGDGPNDVELLANAATALAPADSHPAVLACADRIIQPAAVGGWTAVLDLL